MLDFWNWIEESKKDENPGIIGFCVKSRSMDNALYWRSVYSKVYKTFKEAQSRCKKVLGLNHTHPIILAVFADKSMRPIMSHFEGDWFYNKNKTMKYDDGLDNLEHKAYHGKNDPSFKFHTAINYIIQNVKTVKSTFLDKEIPPEIWKYVDSAISSALDEQNLSFIAQLIDLIKENCPQTKGIKNLISYLVYALNHSDSGFQIPHDTLD